MTDLTPREKALVEATKGVMKFWLEYFGDDRNVVYENLLQALRAYDPPKPKVPQIPAWEELSAEQQNGLLKVAGRAKFLYEQIRTLTSKEAE